VLAEPGRLAVNDREHDHSQAPELTLITKALLAVLLVGGVVFVEHSDGSHGTLAA